MGERLGLRRFPALTAAVLAVTVAVNVAQLTTRGMPAKLERTPAGLHGEWWRSGTSLFVQDGGVLGTVSNLIFLALMGVLAEQVLTRPRWLAHYFGVGLVAEFIAYAWQPTGGGNSIAICGLTGAVAMALWRGDARLVRLTPLVPLLWCVASVASSFSAAYIPAIVGGAVAGAAFRAGREHAVVVARAAAPAVLATGIGLAIAENIHGAALIVGTALAVLTASRADGRARRGFARRPPVLTQGARRLP